MNRKLLARGDINYLDQVLALPMFLVALAFLLITGFLVHMETGGVLEEHASWQLVSRLGLISLCVMYFCMVAETILHWRFGSANLRQHVWFLLFPFLRLCPRDHVDGSHAWVIGVGWHRTSASFEKYLTRKFGGPMIAIALMVLPVVGAEILWFEKIESNSLWKFVIQTATGFIWMAFVFEFVVMITVVEKKVLYCRKNWIDLAVIILPFIAFLRAARLGRLMKLQQLSRTAKVYRVRGLALRAWRAVVALDVIDTILRRDPSYRLDKLQSQIDEKEAEIRELKQELIRLQEKNLQPDQEAG